MDCSSTRSLQHSCSDEAGSHARVRPLNTQIHTRTHTYAHICSQCVWFELPPKHGSFTLGALQPSMGAKHVSQQSGVPRAPLRVPILAAHRTPAAQLLAATALSFGVVASTARLFVPLSWLYTGTAVALPRVPEAAKQVAATSTVGQVLSLVAMVMSMAAAATKVPASQQKAWVRPAGVICVNEAGSEARVEAGAAGARCAGDAHSVAVVCAAAQTAGTAGGPVRVCGAATWQGLVEDKDEEETGTEVEARVERELAAAGACVDVAAAAAARQAQAEADVEGGAAKELAGRHTRFAQREGLRAAGARFAESCHSCEQTGAEGDAQVVAGESGQQDLQDSQEGTELGNEALRAGHFGAGQGCDKAGRAGQRWSEAHGAGQREEEAGEAGQGWHEAMAARLAWNEAMGAGQGWHEARRGLQRRASSMLRAKVAELQAKVRFLEAAQSECSEAELQARGSELLARCGCGWVDVGIGGCRELSYMEVAAAHAFAETVQRENEELHCVAGHMAQEIEELQQCLEAERSVQWQGEVDVCEWWLEREELQQHLMLGGRVLSALAAFLGSSVVCWVVEVQLYAAECAVLSVLCYAVLCCNKAA
eukprot:scaffold90055_cov21-Tisochrysis_lutea.AAC.1